MLPGKHLLSSAIKSCLHLGSDVGHPCSTPEAQSNKTLPMLQTFSALSHTPSPSSYHYCTLINTHEEAQHTVLTYPHIGWHLWCNPCWPNIRSRSKPCSPSSQPRHIAGWCRNGVEIQLGARSPWHFGHRRPHLVLGTLMNSWNNSDALKISLEAMSTRFKNSLACRCPSVFLSAPMG